MLKISKNITWILLALSTQSLMGCIGQETTSKVKRQTSLAQNDHTSVLSEITDVSNVDFSVSGYALDSKFINEPVVIEFYIDAPIDSADLVADQKAELDTFVAQESNVGFKFIVPAQYRDGQNHKLYAYAIDTATEKPILMKGSPITFNFQ